MPKNDRRRVFHRRQQPSEIETFIRGVGMQTDLAQKVIQDFGKDDKFWELVKQAELARRASEAAMERLEKHRERIVLAYRPKRKTKAPK